MPTEEQRIKELVGRRDYLIKKIAYKTQYQEHGEITPSILLSQGIYELSDSKIYDVGARLQLGERVFRYAKIGDCSDVSGGTDPWALGVGRPPEHGIGMSPTVVTVNKTGADVTAGEEGDFFVTIEMPAAVGANDYEGGWLGLHPNIWGCRILKNDVSGASHATKFYLDGPLPYDADLAGTISLTPNIYSAVIRHSGAAAAVYQGIVGLFVPYIEPDVTTDYEDYYTWIQTWGPFPEPQIGDEHEGGGDNEELLVFQNGSLQCYPTGDGEGRQIAGFYIPERNKANLTHPLIMLMISP